MDLATGQVLSPAPEIEPTVINNLIRSKGRKVLSLLLLSSPDRQDRLGAAREFEANPGDEGREVVENALAAESDPEIRGILGTALARMDLSDPSRERRLKAVAAVRASGDTALIANLKTLQESLGAGADPEMRKAVDEAVASLERKTLVARTLRDVFYGVSLGSVLLLAALGLAITFGLMGVINMAHGEMLMLGAYATYVGPGVLQGLFSGRRGLLSARGHAVRLRLVLPGRDGRGALGIALSVRPAPGDAPGHLGREPGAHPDRAAGLRGPERGGQESLLAGRGLRGHGGLHAHLQPAGHHRLRGLRGPFVLGHAQPHQPGAPGPPAVTQDRTTAQAMGIRTWKVDMWTFALGSGIAGLGGLALTQVGNVGPELGQGYIVDSFMVVVLGGVGKLVGTVAGSLGLGMINKFLEPFMGAVLGKIMVLGLIIVFIQKRPQGLFAFKGRSAE